jgi:hypothetical protein
MVKNSALSSSFTKESKKKKRSCSDAETKEKAIKFYKEVLIEEFEKNGFVSSSKKYDVIDNVDENIEMIFERIKKSNRSKSKKCTVDLKSDFFEKDFEDALFDFFSNEINNLREDFNAEQIALNDAPIYWLMDKISTIMPSIETVAKILGESDAIEFKGSLEGLQNSELFDVEPRFRRGKYKYLFNRKQLSFIMMYVDLAANGDIDEIREVSKQNTLKKKNRNKKKY